MTTHILKPGQLSLAELRHITFDESVKLALDDSARSAVEHAYQTVQSVLTNRQTVYSINTGFGALAQIRISDEDLTALQRNLLLSHATGVGAYLPAHVVRLALLLKINGLARGYSGVSIALIESLIALFNHRIYPCIPSKGSVGASGDLAPLAHLSLLLIGEGKAHLNDKIISASQALKHARIMPHTLQPKEGLALINGTQISTALALYGLFLTEHNFTAAILSGALTTDAAQGSDVPFDPRIHQARGQLGQIMVAQHYQRLLAHSPIRAAHKDCGKVQDPYSLRCQPQVMGACYDLMTQTANTLCIEANAVSDNPLVFASDHAILSGGNFHAEPVAFAADQLALAIAEIGALAERRIALLMDPHFSGLPAFLAKNAGVHSGLMIAHVTAAALASENKSLAHPASVDSLPTSANQEDHVSMATYAARRLTAMNENTAHILAIEWLASAQALSLRAPLTTSPALQEALAWLTQNVSFACIDDRYLADDIELIQKQLLAGACQILLPELALPSVTHRTCG